MPETKLLHGPTETFYEMVNIERLALNWTSPQIGQFAREIIGDKPSSEYSPSDWLTLTYSLRRVPLPQ